MRKISASPCVPSFQSLLCFTLSTLDRFLFFFFFLSAKIVQQKKKSAYTGSIKKKGEDAKHASC